MGIEWYPFCICDSNLQFPNLDSILKSRDITLPTKVHIVKALVFPKVVYGCESWAIKKAERWRTDALKLWCCRRLLRVPWTARRSNQSILKEINSEYSLEGLILRLKLQCFGHLMRRVDSLEKTLMLGGIGAGGEGDDRGWDGWMASLTRWTWVWVNFGSWWWTERPGMLRFMGSQRVGHDWATDLIWSWKYPAFLQVFPTFSELDLHFLWTVYHKNQVIFREERIFFNPRYTTRCVFSQQLDSPRVGRTLSDHSVKTSFCKQTSMKGINSVPKDQQNEYLIPAQQTNRCISFFFSLEERIF